MCFGLPLFCHFVCIPLFLECDWEKLARSIGLCIRLYVLSFLKYWPWPWHFIMPRIRTHSIHWLSYTHCQHTIKTIISPFVHSSSWSRRAVAAVGMFCVSFYPIHIPFPFRSNPIHTIYYCISMVCRSIQRLHLFNTQFQTCNDFYLFIAPKGIRKMSKN